MRLDTEERDLTLVAAAVLFGAAAVVLSAGGALLWVVSLGLAAVLVSSSSQTAQQARVRSNAEYNKILAALEQRDAAERDRNEQRVADMER